MCRGHGGHLLHGGEDVRANPHDAAHAAAMHGFEAHRRHLVDARQRSALGRQLLERRLEGDGVVGHRHHSLERTATGGRKDTAFPSADPLNATAGQFPLGTGFARPFGQVEEPVLEARGPEICDEDFHG